MDIYGEMVHPSDSMVMMKQCLYMLSAHVSGRLYMLGVHVSRTWGSRCTLEMVLANMHIELERETKTLWPSGLRRWLKAPFRKGVGLNPTGVSYGHVWRVVHPSDSMVMMKQCLYMLSAHAPGHGSLGVL